MTNLDRVLALMALLTFTGFVAIVIYKVPRLDLGIVVAITLALVVYDLWQQLVRRS